MAHSTTDTPEHADGPGAELARYRELLEPLEQLSSSGSASLPAEERDAWDRAIATLHGDQTDALEIEESIATFARVLWAAPGWSEPPARIARGLVLRGRRFCDPDRAATFEIAQRFADRAARLDSAGVQVRIAAVEVKLAGDDLAGAEEAAALLPTSDPASLSLKATIAEQRGDLATAADLCARRLEVESEPGELRATRLHLASLREAAGDLGAAEAVLREALTTYPDHAAGHLALGRLLHQRGILLEAFAEIESAAVLGLDQAHDELAEIAGELDRRCLDRFRVELRSSRDGDLVELCPPPEATTEAVG